MYNIFSPLKPAKLSNSKGKQKTTIIKIFKVKSEKSKLEIVKIIISQTKLTKAVE